MKTFKQYISEIFDNPYKYNMFRFKQFYSTAYFLTEDEKLFSINIAERENHIVEVGFSAHPNYKSEMSFDMNLAEPFIDKSFIEYINRSIGTDEKLDIDTKDVGRIFATVIKITEEYYNTFKPDVLFFRAKNSEANRVTLYNKIAKRFAKKYDLDLVIKTHTDSTQFSLIKK